MDDAIPSFFSERSNRNSLGIVVNLLSGNFNDLILPNLAKHFTPSLNSVGEIAI
jgi:hypothetical protein